MTKKRTIWSLSIVGIIAVVLIVVFAFGSINRADKKSNSDTIRLGIMTNSDGQYLATIAQNQGYFKKYGVKVKTSTFSSGIETVNALTTNQLDIGYVADFAALNRFGSAGKNDLKIFAKLSSSGGSSTKLFSNRNIKSLADLKGKGIVTNKGTVVDYWIDKALDKAGLKESDVKILPVESGQETLALLQSGKASAAWGFAQDAQKLAQSGKYKVLATQGQIASPTLAFAISNQQFLKDHPKAAEGYLKSINASVQFVKANPQKAAQIIHSDTKIPEETVLATFKSVNFKINLDQNTLSSLNNIYQYLADNGKLKNKYRVKDYLDTSILKKAIPNATIYK
ncbi:ABC transporter substrate-binding protein [Lentilactobacillus hilgardii]|uniref:ABC transporter substrate-binding protein n=1 Tax=Lentilactobacillus hilgardii TaxID=1588 RepID=UPI0021A422D2|nr:ABC transporter substrate-binding protein [Lentilactobacillus hilgardii]MCT3399659.1 hypothetical protein [Lentilactobacillus hilgardii]